MTVPRPYRRIVRPFTDGQYAEGGRGRYILHPKYATDPAHFIRPFLMIQRELQSLFDFIEPSDTNLQAYSFRIHQLLMTTCMEIEANFKAIFLENGCDLGRDGNINVYRQIESSHRLSKYKIKLPLWREGEKILTPFSAWSKPNTTLKWYKAYNDLKHNRHKNFNQANLENLLNSISGLAVLLTAQFQDETFSPAPDTLSISSNKDRDGFQSCMGEYFKVLYPTKWPKRDCYNFNWGQIESNENPFEKYPYQKPEKRSCRKIES